MGDIILVGDLVKFLASGDGNSEGTGPAIGMTGKVIGNNGTALYGSICVQLDKPKVDGHGYPYSEWWTIPSKLKVLGHAMDLAEPVAEVALPEPPAAWDLTETITSLSGSPAVYARGHVRIEGKGIRLQGINVYNKDHKWEDSYSTVTAALRAYIATLPMVCPSVAGTGTMYARCLIRRDGSKSYAVRVQIPGPKLNREWGAEFVLAHMSIVNKIPGAQPGDATASPAETSPTSPAADLATEPVDMATLAVGDELIVLVAGDGMGSTGGPSVGSLVKVHAIQTKNGGHGKCGPIQLMYGSDDDTWWTVPEKVGKPIPPPVFKVGDPVVIVKEGDADGCPHGPTKGTLGVVDTFIPYEAGSCGTVKVKLLGYSKMGYWTTTPAHLAHSPVKPKEPKAWKESTAEGESGACANCGQTPGKHYSGGGSKTSEHFSPPLCPDPHAVCPTCGPCGPQPWAIHKLPGVCKGEKVPF